jgi:hypothetical protein
MGWVINPEAIPLSITNKMQRHTIFFIAVNALHVSGGFSAHHQELKLYTQHLVYVNLDIYQMLCVQFELKLYTQLLVYVNLDIHQMLCVQFELLVMDGETA